MFDIPFGPWVVKPKVVDPLLVFSLAWDARLQGSDRALLRKVLGKCMQHSGLVWLIIVCSMGH